MKITSEEINIVGLQSTEGEEIPFEEIDFENWMEI